MLQYSGFSAWIMADGQMLPEYCASINQKQNSMSAWIAGKPGQKFTVYWKDHGSGIDTATYVKLDGENASGRFLFGSGMADRTGIRVSKTTERPFMFSQIPPDAVPGRYPDELGSIKVSIKRIKRGLSRTANAIQTLPSKVSRGGGDLCVQYGEESPFLEQYAYTWSVLPYEDNSPPGAKPKTYVSFTFRYRSQEWLELQGIAPYVERPIKTLPSAPSNSKGKARAIPSNFPSSFARPGGSGINTSMPPPQLTRAQMRRVTSAPVAPGQTPAQAGPSSSAFNPNAPFHTSPNAARLPPSKKQKAFGDLSAGTPSIPSNRTASFRNASSSSAGSSSQRVPSTSYRTPSMMPGEQALCFDESFASPDMFSSNAFPSTSNTEGMNVNMNMNMMSSLNEVNENSGDGGLFTFNTDNQNVKMEAPSPFSNWGDFK